MRQIVGQDGSANFGIFDEPVGFNHEDFILRDFFGREITGLRKKLAFHAFHYLGLCGPDFIFGVAAVRLGYMNVVFSYLYTREKGLVFEYETKGPGMGRLSFPANPDEHAITFRKGKTRLAIEKSHQSQSLSLDAVFSGRLAVSFIAPYGLSLYKPLRVLNPSEPFRFTFTEKCSPIVPEKISITLDGKPLSFDPGTVNVLYDWSGGYLRRETNWYWAAFCGPANKGKASVGANFAALVNESFYPENAYWINKERTRLPRVIFDFSPVDPYRPWKVFTEDKAVDLVFTPLSERSQKINAFVLKTFFRQFFGTFSGALAGSDGKPVRVDEVLGLAEYHRALW
ncbi:MAG: DUF2804 domain-containing protein [Thermodesulfobacteriota bacterium]